MKTIQDAAHAQKKSHYKSHFTVQELSLAVSKVSHKDERAVQNPGCSALYQVGSLETIIAAILLTLPPLISFH